MRVLKSPPSFKSIFIKNASIAMRKKSSTGFFLVVGTGLGLLALNGFTTSKKVDGVSMFPSFQPGTYLIVDRLSARWLRREYDEGDVVLADCPTDHTKSKHPS
jgi:signal peptidase I